MFMLARAPFRVRNADMEHQEHEILAMERAALERWGRGDPSGYLEISDAEVAYFDNFHKKRIDGLPALTAYYEGLRGKIHVDRFEIVEPRVQEYGDTAILTFVDVSESAGHVMGWNCTEVYRRKAAGWRIVQTHWALQLPEAV